MCHQKPRGIVDEMVEIEEIDRVARYGAGQRYQFFWKTIGYLSIAIAVLELPNKEFVRWDIVIHKASVRPITYEIG